MLLTELHLELGQASLAGAALDQALERGLASERAILLRAKVLFAQGRSLGALEIQLPEGPANADLVRVRLVKVQAEAERSTVRDGEDNNLAKSYSELIEWVYAPPK